ncbi:hypothetical protein HF673_19700 [Acidithiobacillus thiooxidans]|uniref:Hydantoin racemase n=1 Tax=Acidithiobacillus sulfurivorans TaxID=1958756 RepID=A0ABS6A1Z6_9PROT|nr:MULTISPECIES: aspartate/glutamate racemase family protein [Acidithiobacillus]MBU2761543.1 hypothetical protein [Acidithiobacillus sulfurivorans]MBU2837885.1 hypothetical protein [Acidithiobacillus thiooxidans]
MNILVLNPNISSKITKILQNACSFSDYGDVKIDFKNVSLGVEYIENKVEAMIASYAVLDYISENVNFYDAIIIAAFGDPGVQILRKIVNIPVVGLTEASLLHARLIGTNIGIFTISRSFIDWYKEIIYELGFSKNIVFINSLDIDLMNIDANNSKFIDEITTMICNYCNNLEINNKPDVFLLAGAPLAGVAFLLENVQFPVIDSLDIAIKSCINLHKSAILKRKVNNSVTIKKTLGLSDNVNGLLRINNSSR